MKSLSFFVFHEKSFCGARKKNSVDDFFVKGGEKRSCGKVQPLESAFGDLRGGAFCLAAEKAGEKDDD